MLFRSLPTLTTATIEVKSVQVIKSKQVRFDEDKLTQTMGYSDGDPEVGKTKLIEVIEVNDIIHNDRQSDLNLDRIELEKNMHLEPKYHSLAYTEELLNLTDSKTVKKQLQNTPKNLLDYATEVAGVRHPTTMSTPLREPELKEKENYEIRKLFAQLDIGQRFHLAQIIDLH